MNGEQTKGCEACKNRFEHVEGIDICIDDSAPLFSIVLEDGKPGPAYMVCGGSKYEPE